MSGRYHRASDGRMLWIPRAPLLPDVDQFRRFRERRLALNERIPRRCAACYEAVHTFDEPVWRKGMKGKFEQVELPSIVLGCQIRRLELKEVIPPQGQAEAIHIMRWAKMAMMFQARGCVDCQQEYTRQVSRVGVPRSGPYKGRSRKQPPLQRHLCHLCQHTFLGIRCDCGYVILPPAGEGQTWYEGKAYIDMTEEVLRMAPIQAAVMG